MGAPNTMKVLSSKRLSGCQGDGFLSVDARTIP